MGYPHVLNMVADAVLIVDEKLRVIKYANQCFCDMVGYSCNEILKKPVCFFFPALEHRLFVDSEAVIEKEKVLKLLLRRSPKQTLQVDVVFRQERLFSGTVLTVKPVAKLCMNSDAHFTQDNDKWLRMKFNYVNIGIAFLNTQGKWLRVNEKLCEILKYSEEELRRMKWEELISSEAGGADELFVKLVSGKIDQYERDGRFTCKSGEIKQANISCSFYFDEIMEEHYVVATIRDITQRRQNEELLEKNAAQINELLAQVNSQYAENILLNELFTEFSTYIQMEELMDIVPKRIVNLFKYAGIFCVTIFLYEEDVKKLLYKGGFCAGDDEILSLIEGLQGQNLLASIALKTQKEAFMEVTQYPNVKVKQKFVAKGVKSIWSFPILYMDMKIGTVNLYSKNDERIAQNGIELVRAFCSHLSIVIRNALLFEEVKQELRERKNTEEELQLFFTTAQNLLCTVGYDGYFKKVSDEWITILGWSREEVERKPFIEFIHPGDREESLNFLRSVVEKEDNSHFYNRFLCKSGDYRWVVNSARAIADRRIIVIAASDVTRQKETEEHLRAAKDMAEKANKMKSTFLANMSHEIRTPLNAIIGYSNLLSMVVSDNKLKGYVNGINTAGQGLLSLINDILDLSKLEAGMTNVVYAESDLEKLLHEIIYTLEQTAEAKGLTLMLDYMLCGNTYFLDELKLKQVVLNLIGNAIKFTKEGYVKVKVTDSDVLPDISTCSLYISVEDTGIGIPEDEHETVFKAFRQQSANDNANYGGTGLGLTISRGLVAAMGGSISLKSSAGKGSCFTIQLNNVKYQPKETFVSNGSQAQFEYAFRNARVLAIDDSVINLELVEDLLTSSGGEVVVQSNALQALETAKEVKPDVIILDIIMPRLSGWELIRQIKACEELSAVPVIAFTALNPNTSTEAIKQAGFASIIYKPISREAFLEKVAGQLPAEKKKKIIVKNKDDSTEEYDIQDIPQEIFTQLTPEVVSLIKMNARVVKMSSITAIAEALRDLYKRRQDAALKQYIKELEDYKERYQIEKIKKLLTKLFALIKVKGA